MAFPGRGRLAPAMVRLLRIVVAVAVLAAVFDAAGARAASVYATRSGTSPGSVYQLAVAANGDLSLRSPEYVSTTGHFPHGIGITPKGGNLYVTNNESTVLSQFGISSAGLLSPLTPPSATVAAQDFPVAVSPDGTSLYTAHATPSPEVEQLAIGTGGLLGAKTLVSTSGGADDVVLSPDGKHLYVSNFAGAGLISQFEVQAGGALKALSPATVSAGAFPVGMAVTPDGHNLYAGTESSTGILQFTIGANGALSPMTPASVTMPPETNTEHLVVSPDGANLYSSTAFKEGGIVQLAIGAGGALTLLNPPIAALGSKTASIAISPDGRSVYAGRFSPEEIQRFSVGAGGVLTATANTLTQTGLAGDIAVSPDQGPTAALAVTPAPAGQASGFDASGSSDPDGQVVRYEWSFGDGATATTTSATTTHVYAAAGDYTASVTVTDNEGASTTRVFTGHQVLRNGGPAAKATASVHVASPASQMPRISNLKIKPTRFAVGSPTAKHKGKGPKRGAFVSFELSVAGTVVERVEQRLPGHHHNGKCSVVAKKGPACFAWKPLKGSVVLAGKQGGNKLAFSGRFQGKKLKPGRYRFALVPKSEGQSGTAARAGFTILAG